MVVELRSHFHDDLATIESNVSRLFAFVAEDLGWATSALLDGDQEMVRVLTEREAAIDVLYQKVETIVDGLVALQAPVASDLRFLLSVLRVVPELERSHDLVVRSQLGQRDPHLGTGFGVRRPEALPGRGAAQD